MSVAITPPTPSIRRFTADEFESMPDTKGYELDDGLLMELNVGAESSWVANQIARLIANYVDGHKLGWAFGQEIGFRCFPEHPDRVRKPDAAFVRFGRLPDEKLPLGFMKVAPDLVVEVVSPRDIAGELEAKIQEYKSAGVRLIWIIHPRTRTARIVRSSAEATLTADQHLEGEDVLPGFHVRLDDLWPPKAPADASNPQPTTPNP